MKGDLNETNITIQNLLDNCLAKNKRINKQLAIMNHVMCIARTKGDTIEIEMLKYDMAELRQKLKEVV